MTIDQRLTDLENKLIARRDKPIYRENVKALEAEIARLKANRDEK